jgi:hypothetical protein
MASSGFMMFPPSPYSAQVDGSNCIGPRAPALDGPSSAPKPLSTCPMAARTVHGTLYSVPFLEVGEVVRRDGGGGAAGGGLGGAGGGFLPGDPADRPGDDGDNQEQQCGGGGSGGGGRAALGGRRRHQGAPPSGVARAGGLDVPHQPAGAVRGEGDRVGGRGAAGAAAARDDLGGGGGDGERRQDGHPERRLTPPVLVRRRAHIKRYGTTPDRRIFQTARGGILQDSGYNEVWDQARREALTPAQYRSPLGRRPYDLRHAAVSLWLNSGVPATEVARRAGHGVAVLLKICAHCIDGQATAANQRIAEALGTGDAEEDPGDEGDGDIEQAS